jgi:hypothetical protein
MSNDEIVKQLAELEPMAESEYDGRMEEWCFFCGVYNDRGKYTHEPTCLWLKAQPSNQSER